MRKILLSFIVILIVLIIAAVIHREQLKIWLLNVVLIERGVLAVNCFWYRISDMVLGDAAGVSLYNTYKKKYGDFAPTYQFNEKTYLVTNNEHIRTILDNSPDLFSVGILKQKFFKSFMAKNVGVSSGCPWKKRRHVNEMALVTDRLHTYASKYNNDIADQLLKWRDKSGIRFKDFFQLSKIMTAKIVFNANRVSDDVFKIFSEANSIEAFFNPNFEIDPEVYNKYLDILTSYVDNPKKVL